MGTALEHPPHRKATNQTSATPAPQPLYMEYGGPVMEFRQARIGVLDRLEIAHANGNEQEARRLEEEAEVLWWKRLKAMNPAREVPAPILERFDHYPDHPRLPAAARRALTACRASSRTGV